MAQRQIELRSGGRREEVEEAAGVDDEPRIDAVDARRNDRPQVVHLDGDPRVHEELAEVGSAGSPHEERSGQHCSEPTKSTRGHERSLHPTMRRRNRQTVGAQGFKPKLAKRLAMSGC